MKIPLFLLLTFGSILVAEPIESISYSDDSQSTLVIARSGETLKFKAPTGKYWNNAILSGDRRKAFFVLYRGVPTTGSWIEDLYFFDSTNFEASQIDRLPTAIPLDTKLLDASIMDIYAVSESGDRLLVEIHFQSAKSGNSTHFSTYPYFLDPKTGALEKIQP